MTYATPSASDGFASPSAVPTKKWQRGRDSNPRVPCGTIGFPDRCNQPLCHPAKFLAVGVGFEPTAPASNRGVRFQDGCDNPSPPSHCISKNWRAASDSRRLRGVLQTPASLPSASGPFLKLGGHGGGRTHRRQRPQRCAYTNSATWPWYPHSDSN